MAGYDEDEVKPIEEAYYVDLKMKFIGDYKNFSVLVVEEQAYEKYKNSIYRLEQAMRKILKRDYFIQWTNDRFTKSWMFKDIEVNGNTVKYNLFFLFDRPFVVVLIHKKDNRKDNRKDSRKDKGFETTLFRAKKIRYEEAVVRLKAYGVWKD